MKQQILAMEVELTNVVKTQQENDVQIADTKVGFRPPIIYAAYFSIYIFRIITYLSSANSTISESGSF